MFVYKVALTLLSSVFLILPSPDSASTLQSKIFTIGKQGSLDVQVTGADVRLSSWDRDAVQVDAKVLDSRDLDITQVGEKVFVKYKTEKTTKSGEVLFDVYVPNSIEVKIKTQGGHIALQTESSGKVTFDSFGGDVKIGDFDGDLSVKTTGGNVRGGNIKGRVKIDSMGGDIMVESVIGSLGITAMGGDVTVGDVMSSIEVSNSGGDIVIGGAVGRGNENEHFKCVSGSVTARSSGGDLTAYLVPGSGKSTLYSAGGHISLYLPETARTAIDARIKIKGDWDKLKKSIGVRADFRHESYEEDKAQQEIRATYVLNGGGGSISVETLTSGVEIRKSKSCDQF
jgi:DUF4097 and DUF4098 domain-containing protein YvlB